MGQIQRIWWQFIKKKSRIVKYLKYHFYLLILNCIDRILNATKCHLRFDHVLTHLRKNQLQFDLVYDVLHTINDDLTRVIHKWPLYPTRIRTYKLLVQKITFLFFYLIPCLFAHNHNLILSEKGHWQNAPNASRWSLGIT